ncbi:MAG TPA: M20 family metallopeptidase [Chitinophagaceae bacterium]|nr:M20 family metallopeptidase [Chitinophagaceae bacterium]
MIETIRQKARELFPELQRIRHHIHAHPELSFQEFETASFVAAELDRIGVSYTKGIAGTGIVALIEGRNPGKKCLAIRAELDALPITEQNNTAYTSVNEGVMHACGHDVHTACLLGLAQITHALRDNWEGTLKLIFQPGEEMHPGGGSMMIAEGVLQAPAVDAILALHVYPHLPAGVVGFRGGQYMASTDEIHITIEGKGGHAALPHQTIDPIAISAQVIVALQQVISRRSNPIIPSVLSFGKIAGGTVNNVIPDTVELAGTLRTMDEGWRAEAHQLIRDVVTNTCSSFGAKAHIDIPKGYPSLFNDEQLTAQIRSFAADFLGTEHVRQLSLRMTADDFAFYSHAVPGCYFRLGTNTNNERHTTSVHNARFDIDESALETGAGLMSYAALSYLNS